jgi:hypothetical protein
LRERAATARSPIERLIVYKRQRSFANPPFVFDLSGEYTRTYVNADDADVPGITVFTRRDSVVRQFYSGEMSGVMADPGQDQRGRPDLNPLWLMLDLTPESLAAAVSGMQVVRGRQLRSRMPLGRTTATLSKSVPARTRYRSVAVDGNISGSLASELNYRGEQ